MAARRRRTSHVQVRRRRARRYEAELIALRLRASGHRGPGARPDASTQEPLPNVRSFAVVRRAGARPPRRRTARRVLADAARLCPRSESSPPRTRQR